MQNGPKIKIAVSPNNMPLSLQRTDIIGAFIWGFLHKNTVCIKQKWYKQKTICIYVCSKIKNVCVFSTMSLSVAF